MIRILCLTAALLLSACTADPEKVVFETRSAYDTLVLAPAANYNELPRAGTPQCAVVHVCSDQSVVDILRMTDATADMALDTAENLVRNHKDVDPKAAIEAAKNAVASSQAVISTYGVH